VTTPYAQEIFDFFVRERLNLSVHAALPSLRYPGVGSWALSPAVHGQLLVDMLERYLANLDKVRISTLDAMCRSVSARRGGICTFGDCLGEYLAVDPEGWIYACQRFAGMPAYRLGNVHECPAPEMLVAAAAWRMFQDRQERIKDECRDCPLRPVVVLTGGPGGGKSTLIEELKQDPAWVGRLFTLTGCCTGPDVTTRATIGWTTKGGIGRPSPGRCGRFWPVCYFQKCRPALRHPLSRSKKVGSPDFGGKTARCAVLGASQTAGDGGPSSFSR
jgi:radical SAM protein with 4Fe4S-binding SPASM domain